MLENPLLFLLRHNQHQPQFNTNLDHRETILYQRYSSFPFKMKTSAIVAALATIVGTNMVVATPATTTFSRINNTFTLHSFALSEQLTPFQAPQTS